MPMREGVSRWSVGCALAAAAVAAVATVTVPAAAQTPVPTPPSAPTAPVTMPVTVPVTVPASAANERELIRVIEDLRGRETILIRRLDSAAGDEAAQRRVLEQLKALNRAAFTAMSEIEGRCMASQSVTARGYLGINVTTSATVTPQSDERVSVAVDGSVIQSVEPGSPADRAGLMAGDRVLSVGSRDTRNQWPEMVREELQPGRRITVRVNRAGVEKDVVVLVGERPETTTITICPTLDRVLLPLRSSYVGGAVRVDSLGPREVRVIYTTPKSAPTRTPTVPTPPSAGVATTAAPAPTPPTPAIGWGYVTTGSAVTYFGGAQFRALDDDWRSVLRLAPGTNGVLVNEVAIGSMAAQAGLKKGDVITHVDDVEATSPLVTVRLIGTARDGTAQLKVLRGGVQRIVTVNASGR